MATPSAEEKEHLLTVFQRPTVLYSILTGMYKCKRKYKQNGEVEGADEVKSGVRCQQIRILIK
jgi:hypothetical protein